MGWAERNKKEKKFEFQCTKCYGTGIRGFRVDPFKKTRSPIKCGCTLKSEALQRKIEADAKALERIEKEEQPRTPTVEGAGLEPVQ